MTRLPRVPAQRLHGLFALGKHTARDGCMDLRRITVDHQIMGRRSLCGRYSYPVATIVGLVANGLTTDEIVAQYPQLCRGRAGA